jgi:hypothetical protein
VLQQHSLWMYHCAAATQSVDVSLCCSNTVCGCIIVLQQHSMWMYHCAAATQSVDVSLCCSNTVCGCIIVLQQQSVDVSLCCSNTVCGCEEGNILRASSLCHARSRRTLPPPSGNGEVIKRLKLLSSGLICREFWCSYLALF